MTPSLPRRRIALLAGALLLAASVAASAAAALAETTAVENDSARLPQPPPHWPPASPSYQATVRDLHNEYRNIFRHGNRNAASHRWATFLLERAPQMTPRRLSAFFEGFCAVSGSPVRPSDHNRYRLTLPRLGGGFATGYMHYCCWPCVCDTQDYIRVDTLNVTLADGVERTYRFAVIGNPCDRPEQLEVPFVQPFDGRRTSLAVSAREVRCSDDGTMEGATVSDHGYIIIGMFFDAEDARSSEHGVGGTVEGAREDLADPTPGRMSATIRVDESGRRRYQDEREYKLQCADRARNGYNSGMGEIFRKVCAVSPIADEALLGDVGDAVAGGSSSCSLEAGVTKNECTDNR
ncbi:hypothetical protein ACHAXT_010456 [Thalassiosira profunda]